MPGTSGRGPESLDPEFLAEMNRVVLCPNRTGLKWREVIKLVETQGREHFVLVDLRKFELTPRKRKYRRRSNLTETKQ